MMRRWWWLVRVLCFFFSLYYTVLFLVLFNFISMSCLVFFLLYFLLFNSLFPKHSISRVCKKVFHLGPFLWLPDLLFFSSNYWYVSLSPQNQTTKLQNSSLILLLSRSEIMLLVFPFSSPLSHCCCCCYVVFFFVDMSFWYASEGFSLISLIKWKCFFFYYYYFYILLFASFSFNNFFLRFLRPISRNSCFLCFELLFNRSFFLLLLLSCALQNMFKRELIHLICC